MVNWFPLAKGLMEDSAEFFSLTAAEKVYFWFLISEFAKRGPFYLADLEIAVTLGLSVQKVREARRKLTKMGWLVTRPGFKSSRGRPVATAYREVKWTWTTICDGRFFAQLHRHMFEVMLDRVRHGVFSHADLVVYVYLAYLWWKYRGADNGRFFVAKTQLSLLTGLPEAARHVKRLYQGFTFTGGTRLFDYRDEYRRFRFDAWRLAADPSEDERAVACRARYEREIQAAVRVRRGG